MQDSQIFHQKPLQQPQQPLASTMVKVTEEPMLCDDILSCILALDEVIAEFDDSQSLVTTTNGSEPPAGGSSPHLLTTASSSAPIISTPRTKNHHSVTTTVIHGSSTSSSPTTSPNLQKQSHHHYCPSSFAQPQVAASGTVKLSSGNTVMTNTTPSSHQTPHILDAQSYALSSDSADVSHVEAFPAQKSRPVSLKEMENDLGTPKNNKSGTRGRETKIPQLKSSTTPIFIENPVTKNNGLSNGNSGSSSGGGGSFPKVKLRSANPLLEYRSVKMQHFVFPDEVRGGPNVTEENWNFPTGKNLPRSLVRTRDTCGAAEEDNASAKASNPRFKDSKSDTKVSRIPKLRLETTSNVYENANNNLSQTPKVKSPGSVSLDSPGNGGGRFIAASSSNIPVAKPRRNSANNAPENRNDSFTASAIKVTFTPKHITASEPVFPTEPAKLQDALFDAHLDKQESNNNNKLSNNNNHSSAYSENQFIHSFPPAYHQHHNISETDDGYLSMVNKRDDAAPVLWPEEMIENEVFSEDELKRLSFQSGMDVYGDSDHLQGFSVNNICGEISADKTDYFSDDSLESESTSCPDNGIENVKKTSTSISFFAHVDYIRPQSAPQMPKSKVRPSGIPKPCSFFVPIESPAEAEEAGPRAASPKKRGKSSSPSNNATCPPSPTEQLPSTWPDDCKANNVLESSPAVVETGHTAHACREGEESPASAVVLNRTWDRRDKPAKRAAESFAETSKFLCGKVIEDFAQELAYKIGRSGSKEAAATLKEHKLEVETEDSFLENNIVNLGERMSQDSSDGHKTPVENLSPVRTTAAEFLVSNVPEDAALHLTRHEEQLSFVSNSKQPMEMGFGATEKVNKIGAELQQVGRIIANIGKENPEGGFQPTPPRPKSLDIGAFSGRWQSKSDEDNASDDLNETPPAFIPEPPPVINTTVELNSSPFQHFGPENLRISTYDNSVASRRNSSQPGKDGSAHSVSQSGGSSEAVAFLTERKNSRSSEDIIQAVNRDPAPTVGKTRSGAATLPLNSRPPVDGKGSFRPLRSMISRFKKNKHKQSHLSLTDETATSENSESTAPHQQVAGENTESLNAENQQASVKRRNSASSGGKKTNIFARIFLRKNK